MVQEERTNELAHYRKRMRFTQFQVACLVGWKNTKAISRMEAGRGLPTLKTALKLGVIYRTPIEFLFPGLYQKLRHQVRGKESLSAPPGQQALPLTYQHAKDS